MLNARPFLIAIIVLLAVALILAVAFLLGGQG